MSTGAAGVGIRSAVPDDAVTVATMVGELAAHQGQTVDGIVDAGRWRNMLARPEVTVLVAEIDDEAVGYVSSVRHLHLWSGSDVIHLDDLYVRPGHRDRGVGDCLMAELARRADGLTIIWGVQPDNHKAIRFYERLGATVRSKVACAWPPQHQPH